MTIVKEASNADVGYLVLQRFASIGLISLINCISILQSTLSNP